MEKKRPRDVERQDSEPEHKIVAYTNTPSIKLSAEQQNTIQEILASDASAIITGNAGTGKSEVLKQLIAGLRAKFSLGVVVTASTGVASTPLGACTFHSWFGFGLAEMDADKMIERANRDASIKERFDLAKVVIIDEISMLSYQLIQKFDAVARAVRRRKEKPFGGIQVIACGDFLQLPPVTGDGILTSPETRLLFQRTFYLTQSFRQKDDAFTNLLNHLRIGITTPDDLKLLRERFVNSSQLEELKKTDTHVYTRLCCLRAKADRQNKQELDRLPGPTYRYVAREGCVTAFSKMLKDIMLPPSIDLKVGTKVMYIVNSEGRVNGMCGTVIGFQAFNRCLCTTADMRDIETWSPFMEKQGVDDFDQYHYPIVKFDDGFEMIVKEFKREIELPKLGVVAWREQLPLIYGWAITVHKAQGLTLDYAECDLADAFANGMVYVAISRLRSLEGLRLVTFNPNRVQADHLAVQWYRSL